MTRYKAIWVDELEQECPEPPHLTIHEQDEWIDTGLVDKDGNPLYRTERIAMGIKCLN